MPTDAQILGFPASLATDVQSHVATYLSLADRAGLARTCKAFATLAASGCCVGPVRGHASRAHPLLLSGHPLRSVLGEHHLQVTVGCGPACTGVSASLAGPGGARCCVLGHTLRSVPEGLQPVVSLAAAVAALKLPVAQALAECRVLSIRGLDLPSTATAATSRNSRGVLARNFPAVATVELHSVCFDGPSALAALLRQLPPAAHTLRVVHCYLELDDGRFGAPVTLEHLAACLPAGVAELQLCASSEEIRRPVRPLPGVRSLRLFSRTEYGSGVGNRDVLAGRVPWHIPWHMCPNLQEVVLYATEGRRPWGVEFDTTMVHRCPVPSSRRAVNIHVRLLVASEWAHAEAAAEHW
jgi:hypothetical protein